MTNQATDCLYPERKNHRPGMGGGILNGQGQDLWCGVQCPEGSLSPHQTVSGQESIQPEEFLPVVRLYAGETLELFSALLKDHALWQRFRERAAEVFCKEDAAYYLEKIPSFPFLHAHIEEIHRRMFFQRKNPLNLAVYTFHDLAVVAEQVIEEFGINKSVDEAHVNRRMAE